MRQHWEKGDAVIALLHCSHSAVCGCPQPFCANYTYNIFQVGLLTKMFSDGCSLDKCISWACVLLFPSRCLESQSSPLNIMPIWHILVINNISVEISIFAIQAPYCTINRNSEVKCFPISMRSGACAHQTRAPAGKGCLYDKSLNFTSIYSSRFKRLTH